MSLAGIRAGKAFVELGVNDAGFVAGISKATHLLNTFDSGTRDLVNLTQAFKAAGGGAGMLNSALGFIAANPVATTVIAITAAIKIYNTVQAEAAEQTKRINEQSAAYQKYLEEDVSALERKQAKERTALKELAELAKKQELTNTEMETANYLISELETKYGDLGISANNLANNLADVAKATGKVTAEMKRQMLVKLEDEKAYLEANNAQSLSQVKGVSAKATGKSGNWANDAWVGLNEMVTGKSTGGVNVYGNTLADKRRSIQAAIVQAKGQEGLKDALPALEKMLENVKKLEAIEEKIAELNKPQVNEAKKANEELEYKLKTEKAAAEAAEKAAAEKERQNAADVEANRLAQARERIDGMKHADALKQEIEVAKANAAKGNRDAVKKQIQKYSSAVNSGTAWLDSWRAGKITATSEEVNRQIALLDENKKMSEQLKSINDNTKVLANDVTQSNRGGIVGGFNASAVGAANASYVQAQKKSGVQLHSIMGSVRQMAQQMATVFAYRP